MLRLTGLALIAAMIGLVGLAARADSAVTTRIVYHAKLRGNNEILVVPAAGGAPTRLTRHRASDSNPTWSAGRPADRVREQPPRKPPPIPGLRHLRDAGRRQPHS